MRVEFALKAPDVGAGGALYETTMAQAMAAHLAGTLAPRSGVAAGIDDRRLRRALDRIEADLAENLSLDDLAAEAGLSPFHFSRAFRTATGESPLQFVIRRRIETAQGMLRTTRLPLAEIAWRVGYGDVSRFGQHFRRQTGTTPGAWRAG